MNEPKPVNVRKEILVADDSPASLQLLTRILGDYGYTVRPASSGSLALRSAKAKRPDLILLDVKMPDIDGFEVCRSLKADESSRDIPVLFITALDDTVDKMRGFEAGGVDYITKPFEPGEVLARVGIHIKIWELANSLREANESLEKHVDERTEELKRSHDLIKTIMDNMNDAISLIDVRSLRIIGANRMFMELFGGESEIIGKPCYQITHSRSDACRSPDDICPLVETVRTGAHSSAEHIHYGKGGQKIYVEVSTSPIRDKDGVITHVVHVARDITERKKTEEKIMNLNDILRQKIYELGFLNKELESFSYSVSHDLRAPVRRINSFAEIMLAEHEAEMPEECRKFINLILRQSQRMDEIIKALLSLSQVGMRKIQISRLDMNKITGEICNELKEMHPHRRMQLVIKDMPPAFGDPMLIRQVLSNLIGNAVKFTSGKEMTEIEIFGQDKDSEIVYCVRDNGIGFDMKYAHKLFAPFQRLTSSFVGTGLGLSIVQRIVRRHGGRIWAEGERDKGASFWFTLPAIESDES